ncbi:hypothetical protein FB451DRAFT_1528597 [Mycena latifolia]|nr:hypothetical protein FB451DRAFT_1528597 [Mycena latifolia]
MNTRHITSPRPTSYDLLFFFTPKKPPAGTSRRSRLLYVSTSAERGFSATFFSKVFGRWQASPRLQIWPLAYRRHHTAPPISITACIDIRRARVFSYLSPRLRICLIDIHCVHTVTVWLLPPVPTLSPSLLRPQRLAGGLRASQSGADIDYTIYRRPASGVFLADVFFAAGCWGFLHVPEAPHSGAHSAETTYRRPASGMFEQACLSPNVLQRAQRPAGGLPAFERRRAAAPIASRLFIDAQRAGFRHSQIPFTSPKYTITTHASPNAWSSSI